MNIDSNGEELNALIGRLNGRISTMKVKEVESEKLIVNTERELKRAYGEWDAEREDWNNQRKEMLLNMKAQITGGEGSFSHDVAGIPPMQSHSLNPQPSVHKTSHSSQDYTHQQHPVFIYIYIYIYI